MVLPETTGGAILYGTLPTTSCSLVIVLHPLRLLLMLSIASTLIVKARVSMWPSDVSVAFDKMHFWGYWQEAVFVIDVPYIEPEFAGKISI